MFPVGPPEPLPEREPRPGWGSLPDGPSFWEEITLAVYVTRWTPDRLNIHSYHWCDP